MSDAAGRNEALRRLPAVHRLLESLTELPHELARRACQQVLDAERTALSAGERGDPASESELLRRCRELAVRLARPSLRPVLNASGVLLHTNLGRAVLADSAIAAVGTALRSYTNLELDLETGARGSRQVHVTGLLRELTGAEDALVVNNNAAATLLVLAGTCRGREAIVSRGELVEIGGGFRVPEVMAESGAILREVGTTNQTHRADYERALGPATGLIVKVHRSNFAVIGHAAEVDIPELAEIARRASVPLFYDAGSGAMLSLHPSIPTLATLMAQGPDVVTASGDKALGGPQAGLILGRGAIIARLRSHPLARAMRADKGTIAALEETLRLMRDGRSDELPLVQQVQAPLEELEKAGTAIRDALAGSRLKIGLVPVECQIGGGSDPRATLPSVALAVTAAGVSTEEIRRTLLKLDPPVIARIVDDRCLLDLRSILPAERETLSRCLTQLNRVLEEVGS